MSSQIRRELLELLGDIPPAAAERLVDELDPYIAGKVHQARVEQLRLFAELVDRGPNVPLPPNVYSELAREKAEELLQEGVSDA